MSMSKELIKATDGGHLISREEFGVSEQRQVPETAAMAVAAREEAAVKARYVMALQRPRNREQFRVDLLHECKRPGFAAIAEYHRPVGREFNEETGQWEQKIAEGPSVHLIRTAIALYGNMLVDSATMYESAETRIVHAYALDLERNVSWAQTVVISKVIERRGFEDRKTKKVEPPKGRVVLSERVNSAGEKTFTVIATDDEVRTKQARLVAIAQRENGRSVLPRDVIDEARRLARETVEAEVKADPDAAKRRLIDSFAELEVKPGDIQGYLGHALDRITPAEYRELRGVYVAIREGQGTWDDIVAAKDARGSHGESAKVADEKIAKLKGEQTSQPEQPAQQAVHEDDQGGAEESAQGSTAPPEPTEAQWREWDKKAEQKPRGRLNIPRKA